MITLTDIEQQLVEALKARDQLRADTLRGLKTRLMNEKIAKQHELSEEEITALVKSEVKRRKEAAEVFAQGGRAELAQKEHAEMEILTNFLPPEMSESDIAAAVDAELSSGEYTQKDFGKVMGALKAKLGSTADGSTISKLLKERLK